MKTCEKRKHGARHGLAGLLAIAGLVACASAGAQVHPAMQDRWSFQLGLYAPKADTVAYLNSNTGARGTSLSFEDDLNLADRKTMPAFLASVRLGQRWRIEAEYLTLHRDGSRAVGRTFNWGNNTYTVGTVVSSEFNSDIYRLSGGYSFIKDDKREVGVALGLHLTDFEASLSTPGLGVAGGDGLAPLPTVGLYGAYAFTPKWLLSGRLDYFSMNYNEYDGSLVNFNLGVDYRFARHFAAGLAYRHVDYEVTTTKARYNGGVNYKFSGPMFYITSSF